VLDALTLLSTTATAEGRRVTIRRISEQLQEDAELLRRLADLGVRPGATVVARSANGTVTVDDHPLPPGVAQHLFVAALDEDLTPAEAAVQL
jgi:DtxR family Mn-dependent transcriptional regulator